MDFLDKHALILAREIVETTVHWSPQTDRDLQSGKNDNTAEVRIALATVLRTTELAVQLLVNRRCYTVCELADDLRNGEHIKKAPTHD